MCSGPSRSMPTLSPAKFCRRHLRHHRDWCSPWTPCSTRPAWASPPSDHLKRRETVYQVIFIMSIAVCLLQIFKQHRQRSAVGRGPCCSSSTRGAMVAVSRRCPCCLDQHFGTKTVSTTHGLTLSAWAFAGLSGNQLASFVVAHAPDQAHRYAAALIPVLTGLFVVALISISLVQVPSATKAVEDR